MCGITGLVHFDRRPVDRDVLHHMRDSLVHRGPDGAGSEFPEPWVGLGHRRLSIIDVDGGSQPISNEDGTVWVTYNGEIFNFRELREELRGKGHVFKTATDTEVIVHLYEELGPRCVERLNGQFAFALWDGHRLFCARDPIGIKPFYYYRDDKRFAFASEPRAFLHLENWSPEIDLDGIELFFRYRFIPAPATALKGVRKLLPGEWMVIEADGRERRERYFQLDPTTVETLDNVDEARERIRAELTSAVQSQLVADVPLGAFLSGGLDSSTMCALMATMRNDSVRTFSIGFNEKGYDERRFARQVAEKSGTIHTEDVFAADDARHVMHEVLSHIDEPFGDTSILPTFVLSRLARKDVVVAISGDGGDELFAGYGRFFRALHVLAVPPFLRPLQPLIRRLQSAPRDPSRWRYSDNHDVERAYHKTLTRVGGSELDGLFGDRMRERDRSSFADPILGVLDRARTLPPLSRVLAIDMHSILSEYHLVKVDRAAMQNSLEVRVPFLDKNFVDLAFRLSAPVKLHGQQSKGILREAVRDLLPPSVLNRGKKGFSIPFKYWFADRLSDVAHDRLDHAHIVSEGLVSQRAIDDLLQPVRGKTDGSKLWRMLVLESWVRGLRDGTLAGH